MTKGLAVGSILNCADNSGAKQVQIISVQGFKGRRRRKPLAGVGAFVKVRIYSGNEKVMHEMFHAVIIRQRKEYSRPNGMRISFMDNAAILVDENGEPKGTMIKGPVAKEVIERFSVIGKIASIVV